MNLFVFPPLLLCQNLLYLVSSEILPHTGMKEIDFFRMNFSTLGKMYVDPALRPSTGNFSLPQAETAGYRPIFRWIQRGAIL